MNPGAARTLDGARFVYPGLSAAATSWLVEWRQNTEENIALFVLVPAGVSVVVFLVDMNMQMTFVRE